MLSHQSEWFPFPVKSEEARTDSRGRLSSHTVFVCRGESLQNSCSLWHPRHRQSFVFLFFVHISLFFTCFILTDEFFGVPLPCVLARVNVLGVLVWREIQSWMCWHAGLEGVVPGRTPSCFGFSFSAKLYHHVADVIPHSGPFLGLTVRKSLTKICAHC